MHVILVRAVAPISVSHQDHGWLVSCRLQPCRPSTALSSPHSQVIQALEKGYDRRTRNHHGSRAHEEFAVAAASHA